MKKLFIIMLLIFAFERLQIGTGDTGLTPVLLRVYDVNMLVISTLNFKFKNVNRIIYFLLVLYLIRFILSKNKYMAFPGPGSYL